MLVIAACCKLWPKSFVVALVAPRKPVSVLFADPAVHGVAGSVQRLSDAPALASNSGHEGRRQLGRVTCKSWGARGELHVK